MLHDPSVEFFSIDNLNNALIAFKSGDEVKHPVLSKYKKLYRR